jgi:hypothetical protein
LNNNVVTIKYLRAAKDEKQQLQVTQAQLIELLNHTITKPYNN